MGKNISKLIDNRYVFLKGLKEKGVEGYNTKTDSELFDDAVRFALWTLRHWFHYKIPKWLNVMNNLQAFVCAENNQPAGSYSVLSTQIENDFVRDKRSILIEYGVSKSAVDKLSMYLSEKLSEDAIFDEIRRKQLLDKANLIEYEKQKLRENLEKPAERISYL